jgi:hypothetical protein
MGRQIAIKLSRKKEKILFWEFKNFHGLGNFSDDLIVVSLLIGSRSGRLEKERCSFLRRD